MDEQAQVEIKALEDLFESPGWKLFIDAQKAQVDNARASAIDKITNMDQLHFTRGVIATLDEIVNYESSMRTALAANESGEQ